MMEEVVLEGEVEGGGSLQEKEEEEDARLSGSILKDDSIVLFEAGEEGDNVEESDKDLLGNAPDLDEDPAVATIATLNSTISKPEEEDSSTMVDSSIVQINTCQPADTVVHLLSKQVTETQPAATVVEEEGNMLTAPQGEGKVEMLKEVEDHKVVIELLREQVGCRNCPSDMKLAKTLQLLTDLSSGRTIIHMSFDIYPSGGIS